MLRIGIVGKNHSDTYTTIINSSAFLEFVGVFDPGFQFERPKKIDPENVFFSFHKLLKKSEALIFASTEKIYLPLIELAIKHSKPIFLHGVQNLSLNEQVGLLKLQEEASVVIQVQNPVMFNDTFIELKKQCTKPLVLNYNYSDNTMSNLLINTRFVVSAVLSIFKSNIKKVAVNTISSCSAVPDIYIIRLDFDNGSVAEILVNSVENSSIHQIKCFGYNEFYHVNMLENSIIGHKNSEKFDFRALTELNLPQKNIEKQITDFYMNVAFFKHPSNSIDDEINTESVLKKVKEKLQISFNIF